MSIRLKQLTVSLVIHLIHALTSILRAAWWLVKLVIDPFVFVAKLALKPIVIAAYGWYLRFYNRLKRSSFMRNKVLFLFGNKYFIHVLIIILAVSVTLTNVQAKVADINYTATTFGGNSALYQIAQASGGGDVGDLANGDIVESGLIPSAANTKHYIDHSGTASLSINTINPAANSVTANNNLVMSKSGTALVNNQTLQTNNGIRGDFTQYTIQDGDTVSSIANEFGVTTSTLLWANNLTATSYIKPGQTISIPPASGVTYEVADGDTLQKIVSKFNGDLDSTIQVNGISSAGTVAVGSKIIVVGGTPPAPTPAPTPTPAQQSHQPIHNSYIAQANTSTQSNAVSETSGGPGAIRITYPVGCHGVMSTYYGHPNHARDLPCPKYTPVYAALDGTVHWASEGYGGGYGNSIVISSANGIRTRYAHMDHFVIANGAYVQAGTQVGVVGMTGRTTGPHLHFEIEIGGAFYDPINYLQRAR